MPFADPVLRNLDDVSKVGAIRAAIIRTIRRQLLYRRGALDDWEVVHFANAISSLALNVQSLQQPTSAWLRLCLVDLETALLLPADRAGPCQVRRPESAPLGYDELMETLDRVAQQAAQMPVTHTEKAETH